MAQVQTTVSNRALIRPNTLALAGVFRLCDAPSMQLNVLNPDPQALLRAAQELATPYIDSWETLAGKPLDRLQVEDLVRQVYDVCGLQQPSKFVYLDGPTASFLRYDHLNHAIRMHTYSEFEKLLHAHGRQYEQAAREFYTWLLMRMGHHTRPEVPEVSISFGYREPMFDTYMHVLSEVAPNAASRKVSLMHSLGQLAFYVHFDPATVTIMESPTVWKRHARTGPCLAFADGFEAYGLGGVRVAKEWIMGPRPPLTKLLELPGVQTSVIGDLIGWTDILPMFQERTKVIDKHPDPDVGTLLECDLREYGGCPPSRFLRVYCPTGRHIVLRMPPDVPTAQAAQNWQFGLDYRPDLKR